MFHVSSQFQQTTPLKNITTPLLPRFIMRTRHHPHLVRQEVHSRNAPIMPFQRLHTLEISRRPHYPSSHHLIIHPSPSYRTLHSPETPPSHHTADRESRWSARGRCTRPSASSDPRFSSCCRRSPSPATFSPSSRALPGTRSARTCSTAFPSRGPASQPRLAPTCRTSALRPERRSQIRQIPDWSHVAARLPSHWKDRPITSRAWPSWRSREAPDSTSQRRNDESRLTVPTKRPAGERARRGGPLGWKETELTRLTWPESVERRNG